MEGLSKKMIIIFQIFVILMFLLCTKSYGANESNKNNSTSDIENSVEELRNEGMNVEVSTTENETEETTIITISYEQNKYGVDLSWVRKFVTHPMGTVGNVILDIFRAIADAVQMAINLIQTVSLGVHNDWTIIYDSETLENDGEDGPRNQYTLVEIYDNDNGNASEEVSDAYEKSDYKLKVLIDDTEDSNQEDYEYLFEGTRIPIIYVDIYTMALNKVNALDVNFLSVNNSMHEDGSVWITIRDFVASLVILDFYVAAILLITALIWMGVQIVTNSVNPYKKARNKEDLQGLIVGVIMLVGTILIMALSIYSYQAILGDIYDETDYELPIRVYFKQSWSSWFGLAGNFDEYYSFSTNFTGYIRFMAEIENPDRCMEKAGYVIVYIAMVITNLITLIVMIARTVVMWVLSIVGPILASIYAITSSKKVMGWYKSWAFLYIIFALIQVFIAVICVILLNVMDFSS